MADNKVRCPWCAYNKFRCGDEEEKTCDFKSLPMDKDAIVERLREEVRWLNEVRDLVGEGKLESKDVEILLREASDKGQGVQIMVEVLESRFEMKRDQISKLTGMKELSFMNKVRLATKLGMLKAARSGAKK